MDLWSALRTLVTFVDLTLELEQSPFSLEMSQQGAGWRFSFNQERGVRVDQIIPDPTFVKAFVLTWRFLSQPRDNLSLSKLDPLMQQLALEAELPENLIVAWDDAVKTLNCANEQPIKSFLLEIHEVDDTYLPGPKTHYDLVELFIYGELAHRNPDKVEILEILRRDEFVYKMLQNEAYGYLYVDVLNWVQVREHVIRPAIEWLRIKLATT